MKTDLRKKRGVNVLAISGKITIGDGDEKLQRAVNELLDQGERYFVLDLGDVRYMDSAGVGSTVACYRRACEAAGVIKIVAPPQSKARELFTLAQLDRMFEVFDDEASALASFPG